MNLTNIKIFDGYGKYTSDLLDNDKSISKQYLLNKYLEFEHQGKLYGIPILEINKDKDYILKKRKGLIK